jgi:hypothetical protein
MNINNVFALCLRGKPNILGGILFTVTVLLMLTSGMASAADGPVPAGIQDSVMPVGVPSTRFYVWASAGPLAYVSGASVTITNAKGRVIGHGKTNKRGMIKFILSNQLLAQSPIHFSASGGTANDIDFQGALSAEANVVDAQHPMVLMDLISTSSVQLKNKRLRYADAMAAVRTSLGIGKGAPIDILRVKNKHVDALMLTREVKANGGFNRYIKKIVNAAKSGTTMTNLHSSRPWAPYTDSPKEAAPLESTIEAPAQSPATALGATVSLASSSTACTTPVGNGSATTASQVTIANFGGIAASSLMEYIGIPSAANDGITGMLLASVGIDNTSPTEEELKKISGQLDCISSQLAYLTEEMTELLLNVELQLELTGANNCAAQLQTQWLLYNGVVNGPTTINNTDPDLIGVPSLNIVGDLQNWNNVNTSCGKAISNSLFGTLGGQGSAWKTLNQLSQKDNNWYTQTQAQSLQSFLSYWSTLLYQQFVLINEVYNFSNQVQNAVTLSGAAGNGSIGCANGTTVASPTFCAQQSNIQNAFPGNLYSDEAGIWQTGFAINAYPAGSAVAQGTQGWNANYMGNLFWQIYYGNEKAAWSVPASNLTQSAISAFNSQGIATDPQSSAVETYLSPRSLRTSAVLSNDDLQMTSKLTMPGPGGISMNTFFLNAINQVSGADSWNGLTAGQVGFFTSDNISTGSSSGYPYQQVPIDPYASYKTTVHFGNFNGNATTKIACTPSSFKNPCNAPAAGSSGAAGPIMAVLMGRTWWAGAGSATDYQFTAPLAVPSAPVGIVATAGSGSISVAFNLSASDGNSPITGYLVSCANIEGATTQAGSGSPLTVVALTTGVTYNCSVQGQNAMGISLPSATATAIPDPATVAAAPLLTSAKYYDAGGGNVSVGVNFTPSTFAGGGPVTSYLNTCTNSDGTYTVSTPSSPGFFSLTNQHSDTYSCYVQAINSFGPSPASNVMVAAKY